MCPETQPEDVRAAGGSWWATWRKEGRRWPLLMGTLWLGQAGLRQSQWCLIEGRGSSLSSKYYKKRPSPGNGSLPFPP